MSAEEHGSSKFGSKKPQLTQGKRKREAPGPPCVVCVGDDTGYVKVVDMKGQMTLMRYGSQAKGRGVDSLSVVAPWSNAGLDQVSLVLQRV